MPLRAEDGFVPLLPLFDRLEEADEAGAATTGSVRASRREVRSLKASVLRDLAWMLNARQAVAPEEAADLKHTPSLLEGTLARFGLPDITNLDLQQDTDRKTLHRWIKEAVKAFEPRLSDVEVSWVESSKAPGRTTFRVDARLRVESTPERLTFDGEIVWRTRELRLR